VDIPPEASAYERWPCHFFLWFMDNLEGRKTGLTIESSATWDISPKLPTLANQARSLIVSFETMGTRQRIDALVWLVLHPAFSTSDTMDELRSYKGLENGAEKVTNATVYPPRGVFK
jgi:hypothetical protein